MSKLQDQILEIENEEIKIKKAFPFKRKLQSILEIISYTSFIMAILSVVGITYVIFWLIFPKYEETGLFVLWVYIGLIFIGFLQQHLDEFISYFAYRNFKTEKKNFQKHVGILEDLFYKKRILLRQMEGIESNESKSESTSDASGGVLDSTPSKFKTINTSATIAKSDNKLGNIFDNGKEKTIELSLIETDKQSKKEDIKLIKEEKLISELFINDKSTEPHSDNEERRAPKKIDFLKLNETRHHTGSLGEIYALEWEKRRLEKIGFSNHVKKVVHMSKIDDSVGYDILSFCDDGSPKYIEVKTTTESYNSPFYLTETEISALDRLNNFFIYRIYDFNLDTGSGSIFVINCDIDMEKYYTMQPITYRVSPKKLK